MALKIFDAHCDVLMKLFSSPSTQFINGKGLDVTKSRLLNGGVAIQLFAIYVPEQVHPDMRFDAALAMVDLFYEKVIKDGGIKLIASQKDLQELDEGEIGGILTLEGCDCIGDDLLKLKTFLRLGVRSVGLTWNHANLVADGAMEERGGGLTTFGRSLVNILIKNHCNCDISHLSEKGFWDIMESKAFVIASHSNCRALVNHPRNLTDQQLKALFQKNSVVGITFVPEFLNGTEQADITDVLRHIEHIGALGGIGHVGLGSDFDGTAKKVKGLEHAGTYQHLVNELLKRYREADVKNIIYNNFARRFFKKQTD